MTRRSLRSKIRLLILMPLCALGITAVCALSVLASREIKERTQKDARSTSASLSQFLAERLRHLQTETNLLAEAPYIRALALFKGKTNDQQDLDTADGKGKVSYDLPTAQNQVDRYSRFLNGDGFALMNQDGALLGVSGPLKSLSPSDFRRFGVDTALDGRSWSELVRTNKGLALVAAAPLMFGDYPKGVAICYSMITDKVARGLASELAVQVAFFERGTVVANSWNSKPFTLRVGTAPSYVDIGGTNHVGLFATIPGAPNDEGFIAYRSVSEIVGPSRILLLVFSVVFITALIVAAALADRFARGLIRPIELVAGAARVMERGDWPERFVVNRSDEIGDLQAGFNRMADAVRENEEKLLAMVDFDPLTGLPNHRRFKESLTEAVGETSVASLALFGLDRFNDFNRAEGFSQGDVLLKRFAEVAACKLPQGTVFARYGGDVFAAFMPGTVLEQARFIAEQVREGFSQLNMSTVSAGCSNLGPSTDRPESLCLAAELALAQAKQLGRDQVCDFGALAQQGTDPMELNKFLQDGTLATVQALAAAVDAKDSYTKGHSQRVAEYASDLCRHLGGTEQDVELVFRTGTLHDVGKIGVPDEILKKSGPLTADERAIMETHAALGELIVRKVPQLQDTLAGVRNHHERWDGKGYPDGLSGERIPWLGRILAVADTFDAMTSDRPYRKGMPADVALSEISKNAGVQFDPEMAHAFVDMMGTNNIQQAA